MQLRSSSYGFRWRSWLRPSGVAVLLLAQQASSLAVDRSALTRDDPPQHVLSTSTSPDVSDDVPSAPSRLNGRFLHITDMHPDMFYKAHTTTSEDIACHRGQGPAGYYGAETSDCDSPVQLIDSVMEWIKENIKDDIDFVIWTGDSARHDSDEKIPRNASQVLGSNKLMVKKMIDLFSNDRGKLSVPIIPSLGNNDILPHNILMPAPNKWLRAYTDVWKHFIPESQLHSFDNGGWFYTEVIPNKLAIFSINTLYLFDRNAGVDDCEQPSEPGFIQMEWLRIQLTQMRKRGVKAILTGHVPPARTSSKQNWDETCWQKYNLWMTQFRDVIVGTIYGHMNIDHFLIHDSNDIDIAQMTTGLYNSDNSTPEADDETVRDEAASISSSANYLVDLRHIWSKLPDPKSSLNTFDSEPAEFSTNQQKSWKGIGNKYGERYHLSLVSPSIVPNYFPTIRVVSYNTEGLDGPLWSEVAEQSVAESEAFAGMDTVEMDELEEEIVEAMKKKDRKKKKKGDGKPKKDPHLVIPDPPTKGTPPGPAYSMQSLTMLGYVQYYANITTLNNNIKGKNPDKKHEKDINDDKNKDDNKVKQLELRSIEHASDTPSQDIKAEINSRWRSGPHKGKELHKNPKPLPFKFEVEYDTFTDKVYKLKDLTVKSYLNLAYRIAKRNKPKKGKGGKSKNQDVDAVNGEFTEMNSPDEIYERLTEAEEVSEVADVEEEDYEDLGEEEVEEEIKETVKENGSHKKKGKGKSKKKNKAWRQFLEFAFVKTLGKEKIESLDN